MIIAEPIPDQIANNVIEKYIDNFKYKLLSPFRTAWNFIYILGFCTVASIIIMILVKKRSNFKYYVLPIFHDEPEFTNYLS